MPRGWMAALSMVVIAGAGCGKTPAALTQQVEARRLASDLRVQFSRGAEAANRAVMAETDEASGAAAREAREATAAVARDVEQLQPLLQSLSYASELDELNAFTTRFAEYRALDDEILPLAVENTNLKAERLLFGPARDASDVLRRSLEAAASTSAVATRCAAEVQAARAVNAVLDVQIALPRHISEADEAAMSRMEAEIDNREQVARDAIGELKRMVPSAGDHLTAASEAFTRFASVKAEIVTLSRRNSNVRSLALSLGSKRTVATACDEQLRALEEAIGRHDFTATR